MFHPRSALRFRPLAGGFALALTFASFGPVAPAVAQATFTWTGAAGSTDWQDPLNWSSVDRPGGVPGLGDTTNFNIDATASGGATTNFINTAGFTLGEPTVRNQVTIGGLIDNSGTITLMANDVDPTDTDPTNGVRRSPRVGSTSVERYDPADPEQRFQFTADSTIRGGGEIRFVGGGAGLFSPAAGTQVRNLDNTLSGSIALSNLSFVNQGTLNADDGFTVLANTDFDNTGGIIDLGVEVVESGGTFSENFRVGILEITEGSSLRGGTIRGSSAFTIPTTDGPSRELFSPVRVEGVLEDISFQGSVDLMSVSVADENRFSNTARLGGIFENQSRLGFSVGNFFIGQGLELTGGGDVTVGDRLEIFEDSRTFTDFRGTGTQSLVNRDNRIHGDAEFSRLSFTNQGTVEAELGRLIFEDSTVVSTGRLAALSTGTLEQNGGAVTATSIDIASGGAYDLNAGRLETPQFNGDFFQDGGTFAPGNAPGQANGVGDSVLTGNYTIDDTTGTNATLEIELASPDLFDRFTVGGDLNLLSGQLSVVALDGFSVSAGDVFDVVNVEGRRTGTFLGLDEGAAIPGIGGAFSITYAAGDGNDISLVSTLTPGSVNLPVAGTSDVAFVFGTRGPSADQTISLMGLDILPGGDFTLGPDETLNLDDGDGTLFVSEGSTFTGNGLVNGNILNAGLVRIPIVALEQTTGGHVIVTGPTPVFVAPEPITVNAATLVDFTPTPVARIEAPVFESAGTLAFDASLEVTGDFSQTETGALRLFIGGESPGVSFSQLIVGGDITLDGAIEVVWQPELFDTFGFEPELGQTFDFLVAEGQITLADSLEIRQLVTVAGAGFFSGFELSSFDSGISSDPDDLLLIGGDTLFSFGLAEGGTTLRATVLATIPEPATAGVFMLGALTLSRRRSRGRSRS